MEDQYIKPGTVAPQLTRDDLDGLSPSEINQALEAGQLAAIQQGRDPIPQEVTGERAATPQEIVAGIKAKADAEHLAANQARSAALTHYRRTGEA